MNPDFFVQLLQKSFRVTVGAAASLVEALQDPQKREENLARLRLELAQLTEEWAAKGEMTEQEARNFVDTILSQRRTSTSSTATNSTTASVYTPVASPDVQLEIQELTVQIAAIRAELEKIRNPEVS